MPSWRKVILSGSNAALNSLNVTTSITASTVSASSFTGSLLGTSSYSSLSEKVIVTPSLYTPLARPIVVADVQSPGSTLFVDLSQSRFTYAPSPFSGIPTVNLDGILDVLNITASAIEVTSITSSTIVATNGISSSIFIGPLLGTASFATSSISSSYALSASFATSASRAISSSFATSASFVISASFATSASNAISSSFSNLVNISNNVNNRILTAGGPGNVINAEANLTFSGTDLVLTGSYTQDGAMTVNNSVGKALSVTKEPVGSTVVALGDINNIVGSGTHLIVNDTDRKIYFRFDGAGIYHTLDDTEFILNGNLNAGVDPALSNHNITGQVVITGSAEVRGNLTVSNITQTAKLTGSFISNDGNNRVVTSDGDGTFTAESGLTYTPGLLNISGSTNITGSLTVTGTGSFNTVNAQVLNVTYVSSSVVYSSGSNTFGSSSANTQTLIGNVVVTGSTFTWNGNTVITTADTASMTVLSASYASSSTSASYALNATSASYALNATSASHALTASYVNPLRQNVLVTGSIKISGSITASGYNLTTPLPLIFDSPSSSAGTPKDQPFVVKSIDYPVRLYNNFQNYNDNGYYDSILSNRFHGRSDLIAVSTNGEAYTTVPGLFNGSYEGSLLGSANTSASYKLDFVQYGLTPSYGFVYPGGQVHATFYSNSTPLSMSMEYYQSGSSGITTSSLIPFTPYDTTGTANRFSAWRAEIPQSFNYIVGLTIFVTASTWDYQFTEIEYYGTRTTYDETGNFSREGGYVKSINVRNNAIITGSLSVSSSVTSVGTITSTAAGTNLIGTASWVVSSSRAISASHALTASYVNPLTQSVSITEGLRVFKSNYGLVVGTEYASSSVNGNLEFISRTLSSSTILYDSSLIIRPAGNITGFGINDGLYLRHNGYSSSIGTSNYSPLYFTTGNTSASFGTIRGGILYNGKVFFGNPSFIGNESGVSMSGDFEVGLASNFRRDTKITGSNSTSTGFALRVTNTNGPDIFTIRNDRKVGINFDTASLNESLNVSGNIKIENGYLIGTSSWATSSLTASYVLNAQSASYVLNAISSSFASTASFVRNAISASYMSGSDVIASYITASNGLRVSTGNLTIGSQIIYPQGSDGFSVNESFNVGNSTQTAYHFTSGDSTRTSVVFSLARTSNFTNMFGVTGSSADNKFVIGAEFGNTDFEWRTGLGVAPVKLQGGNLLARLDRSGSLYVSRSVSASSFTGSLQGTASWAVSSSHALTASYVLNAQSASYVLNAISSSFASTASYVLTAQTASYVLNAQTASYVLNAQTASYVQTAQTASYVLTAQTASYVLNAISSSFASTASFVRNAQSASYVLNAQSASYILTAQTASYVLNAISSSFASTASYVLNAQSASYVLNAQSASYVLNAQSASYVQTAQTASYVLNAQTASYVQTAQTASYVQTAQTASYVLTAQTASYVLNAISSSFASTASFVKNAQTASYVLTAQTASYVLNAQTASYVQTAQTASYVLNAVSSSFASTASFVRNAQTASYVNPLTQSVLITGSLSITGSTSITSGTLSVYKSSSTVVDVQGSQGSLLRVTDTLSGSLFSVGDISGLPILEVFSDDTVIAGGYNQYDLIVTESKVGIGTSSPTDKLTVSGSVNSITQILTASLYRSESANLTTIGTSSGSNLYEAGFIKIDLGSITGLTASGGSREFNLFNISPNVSYFKNTNFVELKSGSYVSRITFNYGGIPFINRIKGITGLPTIESEEFTFISYVASGSSTNDLADATAALLPNNNTSIVYSTTGLVKLKFIFLTTFFNNYTCSYYSHYEIFKT